MTDKKFISLAGKLEVASVEKIEVPKVIGFENSELKPIAMMTACISIVDIVNANGFLIPRKEMEDMLKANEDYIKAGKAVMLAGHDERPVDDTDVRNKYIAGVIKEVWLEPDGKVFAKTLIAGTDAGKNIVALALAGLGLQASTRLGILPQKVDGEDSLVGAESIFYGFDVVLDPAIENTWLEFKAASKDKKVKDVKEEIPVSELLLASRQKSEELDKILNSYKVAKAHAEELRDNIKKVIK